MTAGTHKRWSSSGFPRSVTVMDEPEINHWVIGTDDSEWLVTEAPHGIRMVESVLRNVYDLSYTGSVTEFSPKDLREPYTIRRHLQKVGQFDNRRLFGIVDRRKRWERSVAGDGTITPMKIADMVLEHLIDIDILCMVRRSPAMLRIDWKELDLWVTCGLLYLGGDP